VLVSYITRLIIRNLCSLIAFVPSIHVTSSLLTVDVYSWIYFQDGNLNTAKWGNDAVDLDSETLKKGYDAASVFDVACEYISD
jgi:hypothetical protein